MKLCIDSFFYIQKASCCLSTIFGASLICSPLSPMAILYTNIGDGVVFKERWFKLKGNLLFYFRLNEHGAVYESEPVGLVVVENCRFQPELYVETSNAFSITYANDFEKRHYFGCPTPKQAEEWMNCLKLCSYQHQRTMLKELQEKIMRHTGRDPLCSFTNTRNDIPLDENDSDSYFNRVHLFSKSNGTGEFSSLI